ncbi:MAG: sulfatase family protein [Myxococcota bacterium]
MTRSASRTARFLRALGVSLLVWVAQACSDSGPPPRPSILLVTTDDQSWLHTGSHGGPVRTPALDRLAAEGVRFTHAFAAFPSCTSSRNAILTGQAIWRLGHGSTLFGSLPVALPIFTEELARTGYRVGFTGKAWGPGRWDAEGRDRHPVGQPFQDEQLVGGSRHIAKVDYAANFGVFLRDAGEDPFFFWVGIREPHRAFAQGSGARAGLRPEAARVPGFLPDRPEVREDLVDYLAEIEHADRQLEALLAHLDAAGRRDDTVVVFTSDNGMAFPRAKANLYDAGTRVPLVVAGPGFPGGRVVDDLVSLTDLAPTFLELTGGSAFREVTGRSLVPLLVATAQGRIDPTRDAIFLGAERHTLCREGDGGYPARAIRTHRHAYIRNYEADRWPAGDPDFHGVRFGDTDQGPTKQLMLEARSEPDVATLFELAFGKRPPEELYDLESDPDQLRNLIGDPAAAAVHAELAERLGAHLAATGDPRVRGDALGDDAPYHWRHPKDRRAGARPR